MTEAVAAISSAIRTAKAPAAPDAVDLFGSWCRAVKYTAPPEWPDAKRDTAYADAGDLQDQAFEALGALYGKAGGMADALLWVSIWRLCDFVDPANPVLPHPENHPWHREMVDRLCEINPALARVAGVTA